MSNHRKSTRLNFPFFSLILPIPMFSSFLSALKVFIGATILLFFAAQSSASQIDNEIDFAKPLFECWSFPTNQILPSKVASDNESEIIVPFSDGKLALLNSETGKKLWETNLGGEMISKPLIKDQRIFIVSRTKSPFDNTNGEKINNNNKDIIKEIIVRSINKKTGITDWQIETEINGIDIEKSSESEVDKMEEIYVHASQTALLLINERASIISLAITDGKILWKRESESEYKIIVNPVFSDGLIIFGNSQNQIIFLSTQNGSLFRTIEGIKNLTAIYYRKDKKEIIWGNSLGEVSSTRTESTKNSKPSSKKPKLAWLFRIGAAISDISQTNNGLLISSLDNFVYLISEDSGNLKWKRRLSDRISAKALITERYAVVLNSAEPIVSIINLDNNNLINKVVLKSDNIFIENPIKFTDKLILTTQRGLFAYSNKDCSSNIKQ